MFLVNVTIIFLLSPPVILFSMYCISVFIMINSTWITFLDYLSIPRAFEKGISVHNFR